MREYLGLAFFCVGAATMWIMSWHYFIDYESGIITSKEVRQTSWYYLAFNVHVGSGLAAISIGPIQLSTFIQRRKVWHRYLGYFYVSMVILSGLSGLLMAPYAMAGMMAQLGFATLSIIWVSTTLWAVSAIRTRKLTSHRNWMFRSYALTFSAITQRTMLLIPLLFSVDFFVIYKYSAWLPWIFNLAVVEIILANSRNLVTD